VVWTDPGSTAAVEWNGHPAVRVAVDGKLERKDNNRVIARRGDGKPFLPKSKAALAYEKLIAWANRVPARPPLGGREKLLVLTGNVYYPDKFRGDLSIELALDAMTKAGIIADDRWVCCHRISKCWDKERPRIDLIVAEIPADVYDWDTGKIRGVDG
jgi:hypothetical protein